MSSSIYNISLNVAAAASTEKLEGVFRVTCGTLTFKQILHHEWGLIGLPTARCRTMQWFDIFGSIDYNYTFFLTECTAAHNGIEKRCICLAF